MVQQQSEPFVAEDIENIQDHEVKQKSFLERFAVAIVFTIFVTFRAADRVFLKALNNALARSSYNLIWGNLFWPIAIQIMTVAMILGYVGYQRAQGDKTYSLRFFLPGSPLASKMGPVPLYQLALFSVGDQLNAAISSPASPFVSQPIQSVMTNAILIWMAICACLWLGTRFKWNHYLGMTLVMAACFVTVAPKLLKNNCSEPLGPDCFEAYHSPIGGPDGTYILLTGGAMFLWYSLFFISTLPGAVGNIYKQKVLQGRDVDVFYATWWSGNFQVLWGLLCLPMMWIPLPGQDVQGPGQFFSEIGDCIKCIEGIIAQPGDESCATQPPPYFWMILYLLFNISFNMCMTWLVKRISANWAQVATVVCLALCNVFSSQRWIMGPSAESMGLTDWIGVIMVCIALVIYNMYPELTANGKEIQEVGAGSFMSDGHANLAEKIQGAASQGGIGKKGSFKGP